MKGEAWYFLPYSVSNGFENMAMDEYFLKNPLEIPLLRGYGFSEPTMTLGRFQKIDSTWIERWKQRGVNSIRRVSGGRAVFHKEDFTYSLVIPNTHTLYKRTIMESYKEISKVFIQFFEKLNIKSESVEKRVGSSEGHLNCFQSVSHHEILVEGKKIIGSAQSRTEKSLLQHGTIFQKVNFTEIRELFLEGISKEIELNFTSLESCGVDMSSELVYENLRETLSMSGIVFKEYVLNDEQIHAIHSLAYEKLQRGI